ncbi:hypothetical protein MMC10_002740 [Thelotrema lepadinum]|nr:hypothetical protein [Thelotrema lepadinum]
MAKFLDLPLELRREIYSYLLLDINVSSLYDEEPNCSLGYLRGNEVFNSLFPSLSFSHIVEPEEETVPRLKFCTSLFTTNKQLSKDALDYFYTENKFVGVECPSSSPTFGCWIGELIPLALVEIKVLQNTVSLEKNLIMMGNLISRWGEKPARSSGTIIVFAARHLRTFAQMLNYWQAQYDILPQVPAQPLTIDLTMQFNLKSGRYDYGYLGTGQGGTISTLVDGLKALRKYVHPTTTTWRSTLHIRGDLPQDLAKEIDESFQHEITVESLMDTCRIWLRQGNKNLRFSHSNLAMKWYTFAANVKDKAWEGYASDTSQTGFGQPTIYYICAHMGLTCASIREFAFAQHIWGKILQEYMNSKKDHDERTQKFLGRLHGHMGSAFMDLDKPSRALRHFRRAFAYIPNDRNILMALYQLENQAHSEEEKAMQALRYL